MDVEKGAPLDDFLSSPLVLDGTLASGPAQARELWALREGVSESLAARGLVHKQDISLPIATLEAFLAELDTTGAAYAGHAPYIFGHVGDGNLHVNALQNPGESPGAFREAAGRMDEALFPLVQKHRGSVSAEHGIGLLKKTALPFTRSPAELALFRSLKKTLDPDNLFNPGKIFDDDSR
jgi:FAD/FMN-containing dehydrogenase